MGVFVPSIKSVIRLSKGILLRGTADNRSPEGVVGADVIVILNPTDARWLRDELTKRLGEMPPAADPDEVRPTAAPQPKYLLVGGTRAANVWRRQHMMGPHEALNIREHRQIVGRPSVPGVVLYLHDARSLPDFAAIVREIDFIRARRGPEEGK